MAMRESRSYTRVLHGAVSLVILISLAGIGLTLLVVVPERSNVGFNQRAEALGRAAIPPEGAELSVLERSSRAVPVASHAPVARRTAQNASSLVDGEEDPRAMLLRQAAHLHRAPPPFLGPCPCPGSLAAPGS
jgi:hypothetical protein